MRHQNIEATLLGAVSLAELEDKRRSAENRRQRRARVTRLNKARRSAARRGTR